MRGNTLALVGVCIKKRRTEVLVIAFHRHAHVQYFLFINFTNFSSYISVFHLEGGGGALAPLGELLPP